MTKINLNELAKCIHKQNHKWWHDAQGNPIQRNKAELICLMHSELSEAMEGERKQLKDTHLADRMMAEVELADCIIRILDYCGAHGYDVHGALFAKLRYNQSRADHKHAARAKKGGKKF